MKANTTRGSGFRGALNYIFDVGPHATGKKNPERIGGNVCGDTPEILAREFGVTCRIRPDIKRPVWHCSLALPSGEIIFAEQWDEIVRDFLVAMGFDPDRHMYVVVRHNDTVYDHVHIIVSRIGLDSSVWYGRFELLEAIKVTQHLEERHNLTLTSGLGERERSRPRSGELRIKDRTARASVRQRLQGLVDAAALGTPSVVEFAERLESAGVSVRANLRTTGCINGFSFQVDDVPFKSSDLGAEYKWENLRNRVTYDPPRDSAGLKRFQSNISARQLKAQKMEDLHREKQAREDDYWDHMEAAQAAENQAFEKASSILESKAIAVKAQEIPPSAVEPVGGQVIERPIGRGERSENNLFLPKELKAAEQAVINADRLFTQYSKEYVDLCQQRSAVKTEDPPLNLKLDHAEHQMRLANINLSQQRDWVVDVMNRLAADRFLAPDQLETWVEDQEPDGPSPKG